GPLGGVLGRRGRGHGRRPRELRRRARRGPGTGGQAGWGKPVPPLAVMRLVASPPGRITSGTVVFDGRDLLSLSLAELREVRGDQISMGFQGPMTSLNPAFT